MVYNYRRFGNGCCLLRNDVVNFRSPLAATSSGERKSTNTTLLKVVFRRIFKLIVYFNLSVYSTTRQLIVFWLLYNNCWRLSLWQVQPGALNGAAALNLRHVVPWKVSRTVRCTACDITLNSQQQARQHYNGKAHQRRLQKLHQQQRKEPPTPDTETETPTTESRDGEPKQDADAGERQSSGVDGVTSEQPDAEAVSMATTHDSEGEWVDVW